MFGGVRKPALLQRPSDRTISRSVGLGVRELVLVRVQEIRDVALGGFPAEFLVEGGDQFTEAQSAMTLEYGSNHVHALKAAVWTRFATGWIRGYGFSLATAGLSHRPGLAVHRRGIAMGSRILGRCR